jgi:hypothetical protein
VADTGQGQAAPPPRKGGKQVLGMPRGVVIAAGAALLLGVGFMWWRSRKSAAAAASTAGTAGTSQAPGPCYDAAGNVVDCSDPTAVTGPNASTFQTEIQDLQGQLAAAQQAAGAGAAGQQATTGEQETDLSGMAADEARLQQQLAELEQDQAGKKPGPKPRPKPRPKPKPRRPPPPRPRGVHTAPMKRAHAHRAVA